MLTMTLHRVVSLLMMLLMVAVLLPARPAEAATSIIYVDVRAGGSGNGTTWANAYTDLRDAISSANPGSGDTVQIWVAAGVYYPTNVTADRDVSFELQENIELYGGFAGTETTLEQRNPRVNQTILSGDIARDDDVLVATDPDNDREGVNSYHVVQANGVNDTAVLDGFIITAGHANGSSFPDNVGGGIYLASSGPIIRNVIIIGNAAERGGGIYNRTSEPTIINTAIVANTVSDDGGGMMNGSSSPRLVNVLFSGNTATNNGGGLFNSGSSPILTNVTIAGNYADSTGGILNDNDSDPALTNTIVWGNDCFSTDCQVQDLDAASNPTYDYSLVEGLTLSGTNFDGNNPANAPDFVVPVAPTISNTPNADGDYHLQESSPLIDASVNFSALGGVANDLDDTPRFVGNAGTVDLGAYELQCPTNPARLVYVDGAATGTGTGINWDNATPTVQEALALSDRCPDVSEIWVAAGTYYPDTGGAAVPNDRNAAFELRDEVQLYGGFAGTETNRSQRDPAAHGTILSGDIGQNDSQQPIVVDVETVVDTDENSYHVVYATNVFEKTIFDGFTITAGNADRQGERGLDDLSGAGIWIDGAFPQLLDLRIEGNTAAAGGGGMRIVGSGLINASIDISDVLVVGNSAGLGGGGANTEVGFINMNGVRFIDNQAGLSGGGVVNQGVLNLVNAVFASNQVNGNGGALLLTDGSAILTNVLIHGNVAGGEGGGIGANDRLLDLTNTTIAGNRSTDDGGGLHADIANEITITNSIIAGNSSSSTGDQIFIINNSTPTYEFSLVGGENPGGTNLPGSTDPVFVSPVAASSAPTTSGNYRLQAGSPVIDQGDNSALMSGITTDLDDNPRIVDGDANSTATVDLGPYERDVRAPTAITLSDDTVVEDSADGSRVGTLTCTDPESGDTTTLSLPDNAGGRFAISGSELQVGTGSLLDYESATSHEITVRCTDSNNLSIAETFTITVENVPEPGDNGGGSDQSIYLPAIQR